MGRTVRNPPKKVPFVRPLENAKGNTFVVVVLTSRSSGVYKSLARDKAQIGIGQGWVTIYQAISWASKTIFTEASRHELWFGLCIIYRIGRS